MKEVAEKINNGPHRKLSFWRVLVAVFIVGAIIYGLNHNWNKRQQKKEDPALPTYAPWFAAYVDVTATPNYAFEQLGSTTTPNAILSFVVSATTDACTPSWGNYYTMEEAATALDFDRRIARLQQQGGKIAVSFGGALNSELALGCTDNNKLADAYRSVIERYNIDTIDLDLENQSLKDAEASMRRAEVISQLQKDYRSKNKNLAVWLTLPVAPQGLTVEGTEAVAKMLASGVDIAGINLMVMDYGGSREPSQSMFDASKQALIEAHRQLGILYQQAGTNLNSQSLWRKIGATPMIGQNDIKDEVFTIEDAQALNSFSLSQNIGRMSMWSANRDIPCGENYVDIKVVSDSCSGVKTSKSIFAQTLSAGFNGDLAQSAGISTKADPENNFSIFDDPDRSPYQVWQETGAYPKGVKVVWHGNVYEAKWWTKNDLPDNPVLQLWETPWQLVGPVLSGEKPVQQPTLPKGIYPKWNGEAMYEGGDRVLFDGTPFQAKWWNQGDSPAATAANSDASPWMALTQSQIKEILDDLNKKTIKK
ncbi:MAG: chitinase [Parcubacteria group bacterium]|jgi:chitinase